MVSAVQYNNEKDNIINSTNIADNNVSINETSIKKYNTYDEFLVDYSPIRAYWYSQLTQSEKDVIKNYMEEEYWSSYKSMNGFLRENLIDFSNKILNFYSFGFPDPISFSVFEKQYGLIPDFIKRAQSDCDTLYNAISKS